MTEPERRFLLRKVLCSPLLWAFSVVAAGVGVDAAVDACRTREIPECVRDAFAEGVWTSNNLPSHAEAVCLTWAPRVSAVLYPKRPSKFKGPMPPLRPLRELAISIGLSLPDFHAVRRVLDNHKTRHNVPG